MIEAGNIERIERNIDFIFGLIVGIVTGVALIVLIRLFCL
jgi:hypothetical protein